MKTRAAKILKYSLMLIISFAGPAFAIDCDSLLTFNVNAHKNVALYEENNTRGFESYSKMFGYEFLDAFIPRNEVNWLDVGGGYGLAALSQIVRQQNVDATVINSQNNWDYILNLKVPPPVTESLAREKIVDIGYTLGVKPPLCLTRGVRGDVGWKDFIAKLNEGYARTLKSGKFQYKVGFAEKVMPELPGQRQIITDVFGAYTYSADRITLLDLYYEKLALYGTAFIAFESTPDFGAPFSAVTRIEGSSKSLEQTLVELFPTVFSIKSQRLDTQWIRVLQIYRSSKIPHLDLREKYEILRVSSDSSAGEVMRQIPQTVLRTRLPVK